MLEGKKKEVSKDTQVHVEATKKTLRHLDVSYAELNNVKKIQVKMMCVNFAPLMVPQPMV